MSKPRFISPEHLEWLESSAIPADRAKDLGIWTVTGPDDLTGTGLEYLAQKVPGITGLMFTLRQVDGALTYQMRVDPRHVTPEGADVEFPVRKYVQEAGVGAIINVPEARAHLVDTATKVLVVEGTKQTIAANLWAAPDYLVVGIQGARNWSSAGVPLPVMSRLIGAGRDVVLCFDADWQTNPAVWDAAKYLSELATGVGAKSAKLITVPGGGKMGLDDFLGCIASPDVRPLSLQGLIESAKKGLGRKPAAKNKTANVKRDESMRVDTGRGLIMKVATSENEMGNATRTEEVALNVAAEIIASEAHVDEDTGDASNQVLTLKVYVPFDGETEDNPKIKNYQVKVPSSKLADVGVWLDRLPHGYGVRIPRKTKPDDDVANAIRSFSSNIRPITVVSHTGWTFDDAEEMWRWCDGMGAIGPIDKVDRLHGNPGSEDFKAIKLPAPPAVDENGSIDPAQQEALRLAVREFIMTRERFNDAAKFNWEVGLSAWALAFLGVTPNAAICFFGPPASGKSTIAQAIAASLNEHWAPRTGSAMATFNARPAGMDLLPDGLDHCFLHVDDLKPEADPQSMKAALKAFDALLRRAHGSGGAVRGTIDKQQDRLAVRKVDSASPLMIITGEEIPTGEGFAESGLDRALFIPIQPNTQLRSMEDLAELERSAASGRFKMATTAYLMWIAGQINSGAPVLSGDGETPMPAAEPKARFATWKAQVENQRQAFVTGDPDSGLAAVDSVFPAGSKVSNRARMLTASLLLGMEHLLRFATETSAITGPEAITIWNNFGEGLRNSVLKHTTEVMGGNMTPADRALASLRSLVASRRVTLDPVQGDHKPLIGQVVDLVDAGPNAVAINHIAAAEALRYPGGGRALLRDLSDALVLDGPDGKKTRTLKIGGHRTQVCVIPGETWGLTAEDVRQNTDVF
ncbi:DUF3854 domain-containing protein [Pseudactinotalea terrae]|uniref:DUF3854 domain-containing protein n=1 Tax=Pseudactinotalea terrae TaxID=1743262 RepID=UPI0012E1E87C|nr:DUF3854 domain-containing protein [Pseudactinotalea terrae]